MQQELHNTHSAVKTILETATSFTWSLQGMGMFRLYLSRDLRIHVWDKRFAIPQVTMVHDHPFDFESHVLWGTLMDKVYIEKPGFPANYTKQTIVCGEEARTVSEEIGVHLQLQQAEVYKTGDRYTHTSDELHETEPKNGTVTLMVRSFKEDTEHARVYFPAGTEFVSAAPRPATIEEVTAMAFGALENYEEW